MGRPDIQCTGCLWRVEDKPEHKCVKRPIMRWVAQKQDFDFSVWQACITVHEAKRFACKDYKPRFEGQRQGKRDKTGAKNE